MAKNLFDDAYADCLGNCFKVLVDNLIPGAQDPGDPEQKFRACCDWCRKAKEVADRLGPTGTPAPRK